MSSAAIIGERKVRLVKAVSAAFQARELKEIVQLVDPALAVHVNWEQSAYAVVQDVFDVVSRYGNPAWVQGMVRSARRARRENLDLASEVCSCWRYAAGLTPESIDDLVAALDKDGVALVDVEQVVARFGKSFELLRRERGMEALADLVERLAGHERAPGEHLVLLRVVQVLQAEGRPALADWWHRVAPLDARSVDAATSHRHSPAMAAGATRMLVVLLPEDDDRYSVEVFLGEFEGLPFPVAAVDRPSTLAEIPSRINEQLLPGKPLFEALYTSDIEQIDVALPLRDVLVGVDEWKLGKRVLSIGRAHRVVVRCLERNLPRRHPEFFPGFRAAARVWKKIRKMREMHSPSDCRVVRWFEAAEQLAPEKVDEALGDHAEMKWLVAAVCADASAAARREALEMMIHEGVTAALWVRGDVPAPARSLLEPACAQPLELPLGIREHRNAQVKLSVTLLWDDQTFRPEKWDE